MILPVLAIVLGVVYFWLDRTGTLRKWSQRAGRRAREAKPARRKPVRPGPPELVDRLKVFQDFLENLPPSDDSSDSGG